MSQSPVAPPSATPISPAGRVLRALGAAVTISLGLALAWPFRIDPTAHESAAAPAVASSPAPPAVDSAQVAFQIPGQLPAAAPLPSPKLLTRQVVATQEPARPAIATKSSVDLNPTPPALAPQFTRGPGFAGGHARELRDLSSEPLRDQESREHRLVDGDTLRRLAQRYLGDANRWPEIQAANADALANPAVIPLGRTIRIPPRSFSAEAADSSQPELNPLAPRPISEPVPTLP